jgi:enoyl-CoA hydratase/carnithine racemase
MTYEHLLTRIDETGVNCVSLDRPGQRNALNAELVAELKDALALADADDRVRVVLLTGEGPDFCAGADLREVQESIEAGVLESLADAESLGELFLLLRKLRKPVVAASAIPRSGWVSCPRWSWRSCAAQWARSGPSSSSPSETESMPRPRGSTGS